MTEQRWVFVIRALDKPGTMTAVASVFSNRGVSLEATLGSGIDASTTADARLIISFRATEAKKTTLYRATQRLSSVVAVAVYAQDDPGLRAIALAQISDLTCVDLANSLIHSEIIAKTPDHTTLLLAGCPRAIEHLLTQLRQQQILLDVVMAPIGI